MSERSYIETSAKRFRKFTVLEKDRQGILSTGLLEAIDAGYRVRCKDWRVLCQLVRRTNIKWHLVH
jgi:hypothetical protein